MTNKTEHLKITWDEFEQYKPMTNHIDSNASLEGCMFETYGDELAYVQSVYEKTPQRVWTYIDCGDEEELILDSGFSFVNRIGYVITEKPVSDDVFISVVDE